MNSQDNLTKNYHYCKQASIVVKNIWFFLLTEYSQTVLLIIVLTFFIFEIHYNSVTLY